jgi:hypothetical protein
VPESRFESRAWAVPRVVPRTAGGSRVSGSLLGLDLARAADQLRRIPTDGLPERPIVSEADYVALASRLVLRAPDADWNVDGRAVADAIAAGRSVVNRWVEDVPPEDAMAEQLKHAGLSEWRINLARTLLAAGESDDFETYFTMTDYYRLGTPTPLPTAWGQPGWLIDACWCLRQPERRPPEDWLGRTASLAATVSSDLSLRLTELVALHGLPFATIETLLPFASEDLITHARQVSTMDWEAFAWPRSLDPSRLDAYLLNLLAEGWLTAPRGSGAGAQGR